MSEEKETYFLCFQFEICALCVPKCSKLQLSSRTFPHFLFCNRIINTFSTLMVFNWILFSLFSLLYYCLFVYIIPFLGKRRVHLTVLGPFFINSEISNFFRFHKIYFKFSSYATPPYNIPTKWRNWPIIKKKQHKS
jgi:hypothetical protein